MLIAVIALLSTTALTRDFRAKPNQKIHRYWLEKDYTKMPFEDRLNYTHAGFKVVEYNMDNYTLDEWKGVEDKFTGEDYYHVLIASNETMVKKLQKPRFCVFHLFFSLPESSPFLTPLKRW